MNSLTVDELIQKLQQLSEQGCGDYLVSVEEYVIDDGEAVINKEDNFVELSGHP